MVESSKELLHEIDKKDYQRLFNTNMIYVQANVNECMISSNLLMEFLINDKFYQYLNECIKVKSNLQFVLKNNNEIISKVCYSVVAIVSGIEKLLSMAVLNDQEKLRINFLKSKIDFNNYFNDNGQKEFEILVDNRKIALTYADILSLLKPLKSEDNKRKYFDLTKEEYVYCLKEFFVKEKLFDNYLLDDSLIKYYQYLILTYDTEAINKFLISKPLDIKFNLNPSLVDEVYKNILTKNKLEQVIYIYYFLSKILIYDEEYDEVDSVATKHKDFSRIELISSENNRVVNYEFSAIFAKFLENLNINYEYNDAYISFRINKYLLKIKSLTKKFNQESIKDILEGFTILNHHKNTREDFRKVLSTISKKLYEDKINVAILAMSYTESVNMYQMLSTKNSINFREKLELLISLISNPDNSGGINMGYIYQLKTILFNDDELNSNIKFVTMSENTKEGSNPIVIITFNEININLYNSNSYIYYNPPYPLEEYNLQELRKAFFNGRFSYIKGTKESIIGLEKSSVC